MLSVFSSHAQFPFSSIMTAVFVIISTSLSLCSFSLSNVCPIDWLLTASGYTSLKHAAHWLLISFTPMPGSSVAHADCSARPAAAPGAPLASHTFLAWHGPGPRSGAAEAAWLKGSRALAGYGARYDCDSSLAGSTSSLSCASLAATSISAPAQRPLLCVRSAYARSCGANALPLSSELREVYRRQDSDAALRLNILPLSLLCQNIPTLHL